MCLRVPGPLKSCSACSGIWVTPAMDALGKVSSLPRPGQEFGGDGGKIFYLHPQHFSILWGLVHSAPIPAEGDIPCAVKLLICSHSYPLAPWEEFPSFLQYPLDKPLQCCSVQR